MPKLRDPRLVKIFFSSPFGGMEEEREELTRRYFPQIHHLCNSKGLQFIAVDMRWGITSESSENAQVINICLREIDRSDMFIGFFGQRYGWHGENDMVLQANFDNAAGRYPWLNQVREKSVTELEFLHGFLNNPGRLPASLLFRDKSYDDKMRAEGEERGDTKQVFKYSAESELSSTLMEDLKGRVGQNKEKSLGVHLNYKTPAEGAEIMFKTIIKYLKENLLVDLVVKEQTKREEILAQHDSFLASRCNIFVGGNKYIGQMEKQLAQANPSPILVTGDHGSGKSALLCNLVSRLKQDKTYAVVYHFIGFAEGSTEITAILARLLDELSYILNEITGADLKETQSDQGDNTGEEGERHRDLMQKLVQTMQGLIKAGKTPVIVLDGLDKVKRKNKLEKAVYWIPENFPSSSVVVVSTLSSDAETIKVLGERQYVTIEMEPLPLDNQHEMCVKTLAASGKELSQAQLDRIVAAEMTKNPLFLKITLSELISFGYFRLLDKKIDSLISSKSIEELFEKFLQRLEEDYNVEDYTGNLVEQVMCSICLSRQGMSETELKEMFDIPDHIWSPLYFAIEHVIVDQSGLLKFGFSELKDAVEVKYLAENTKRKKYLNELVDYFQVALKQMNLGPDVRKHRPVYELPWLLLALGDKKQLAECLAHYNVFTLLEDSSVYDLVFLWRETGVSKQEIVSKLLQTFDNNLADMYVHMEKRYLLDTCVTPGVYLEHFLRRLDRFLTECGFHEEREKAMLRNIQVLERGLKHNIVKNREELEQTLHDRKYKLACLYCQTYHQEEKGIKLLKQLLEHLESEIAASGQPPTNQQLQTLGHYYHGIGVGLMAQQEYEKLIEYCQKSIDCHERSTEGSKLRDIASSHCNLGLANMHLENFDKALAYFKESIRLNEEAHFGQLPPIIGEMLTNMALCYRKMGKLEEAEQTYMKNTIRVSNSLDPDQTRRFCRLQVGKESKHCLTLSLKVKENALGHDHPVVAVTYMNLGTLQMYRENSLKSLEYNSEALRIYEKLGQTWNHPEYVMCQENCLCCLSDLQRYEEADKTAMQLLDWRVKDKSMDKCLPGTYRELVKYYIREGRFKDGYKMTYALLDSIHKDNFSSYIHMDWCLDNMEPEYRQNLPKEFTLESAVEKWPDNASLIKYYVQNQLLPARKTEEIVRLINRLHSLSDMGADVYVLSCPWCATDDNNMQEDTYQRIVEEGLKIYPDNLDLLLAMAKSLRRQEEPGKALPYVVKVADQQEDNFSLLIFASHTAALAGDYDTCKKFANIVLNNCSEENVKSQAQTLLDLMAEAPQDETAQTENQSQSNQEEIKGTEQIQSQS